jgi:hypothetical protein
MYSGFCNTITPETGPFTGAENVLMGCRLLKSQTMTEESSLPERSIDPVPVKARHVTDWE